MHGRVATLVTFVAVLIGTALVASACTQPEPGDVPPRNAPPASQTAPDAGLEDGATDEGNQKPDPEALLNERCTVCHDLARVNNEDGDRARWEQIITQMQQRGANVTDEEKAILAEYLATRNADN